MKTHYATNNAAYRSWGVTLTNDGDRVVLNLRFGFKRRSWVL